MPKLLVQLLQRDGVSRQIRYVLLRVCDHATLQDSVQSLGKIRATVWCCEECNGSDGFDDVFILGVVGLAYTPSDGE